MRSVFYIHSYIAPPAVLPHHYPFPFSSSSLSYIYSAPPPARPFCLGRSSYSLGAAAPCRPRSGLHPKASPLGTDASHRLRRGGRRAGMKIKEKCNAFFHLTDFEGNGVYEKSNGWAAVARKAWGAHGEGRRTEPCHSAGIKKSCEHTAENYKK